MLFGPGVPEVEKTNKISAINSMCFACLRTLGDIKSMRHSLLSLFALKHKQYFKNKTYTVFF
ncbi:hypothetical protein NBRC116600_04240 [Thalassotalea sp. SU-HH00458]